ncbi:GNAT family N-acetyltransferase [Actinokineospora sp. 24-640]
MNTHDGAGYAVDPGSLRRIRGFSLALALAQATDVTHLGWGYALNQHHFPVSWEHNRILVTEAADPDDVLAEADAALGALAGHRHRLVWFQGEVVPECARAFSAAGYAAPCRIITMVHTGDLPAVDTAAVEELDFTALRPSLIDDQKALFPYITDEEAAQLADRTTLVSRHAELTLLAVRAGTEVLCRAQLRIADGVAQIEDVYTRPEHRARGLAIAVVVAALRRARAAGADIAFIRADADDWPSAWYRRLGFRDVDVEHEYTREPA